MQAKIFKYMRKTGINPTGEDHIITMDLQYEKYNDPWFFIFI